MENKEKNLTYFDRFLYKFVIGLIFLLIVVVLDYFKIIDYSEFKNSISDNFNVLKTIETINGNVNIIDIGKDDEIQVSTEYYQEEYITNDTRKVIVEEFSGVKNRIAGVVIKIVKDDDYEVSILGIDDVIYVYSNLTDINCHIYEYFKTNQIIGNAIDYYILRIE